MPQIDESQDWHLLEGNQNSTHTVLQFTRPLISCDKEMDRDITKDTIRVIYAFGDYDPNSESDIQMHGRHQRGTKSILLFWTQTDSHGRQPQETDLQKFNLNVNNVCIFRTLYSCHSIQYIFLFQLTIPKKDTTYWCKIFKIPDQKIHVVKVYTN